MSEQAVFAPLRAPAARPQLGPATPPAWQPWEMSSLPRVRRGGPAAAAPLAAPAAAAAPQQPAAAAELERLRREAREAGFAQGREQGLVQGRAEGRAEGHAAGLAAGQAQAAAHAGQLRLLADGFARALRGAEREVATALTALALDIARQVVQRTLAADPQCLVPVVQTLLRQEPALRGDARLLLHPSDLAAVEAELGAELRAAGWQLRADEGMSRGGCLVQAATGSLDATIETRWARIAAALDRTQG